MREIKTVLLGILLLTSLVSAASLTANAQSSEIVIDSAVEWVEDRSLDGNLRIVPGGYLIIDGITLDIADDVTIMVEDGGTLDVTGNSQMIADNPPTGLAGYGYWDEENRSAVLIPGSDYDLSLIHI